MVNATAMQLAGRTARKPIRSSDSRFGAIEYAGNGAAAAVAAAVDARGRSAVSGRLGCRTDMIDRVTSERRSEIMRSAGQKGAGAEMKVRRARRLPEYRHRRREPPGKPDIVFPSRRKTAFVHNRFRRGFGRLPKSDDWAPKIAANRDERNAAALRDAGWAVAWQYDLHDLDGRRIVSRRRRPCRLARRAGRATTTGSGRPIAVDLFCDAGGLSLGFEQAGFDVAAAVEIGPRGGSQVQFPATALRSAVGLAGRESRSGVGSRGVDVVFGGAPCQEFSLAERVRRSAQRPRQGVRALRRGARCALFRIRGRQGSL